MPITVDPGGSFGVVRTIVRVRGTGSAAGVWRVGAFVNGTQRAYRAFSEKTFVTLTLPLIAIQRGDTFDIRLYRLPNEATAPAQIAEYRLETLSHIGCDPYAGGPLEGGVPAAPELTPLEERFLAHLEAVERGETNEAPSSNFIDPQDWSPVEEEPDPPWESENDPLNPGPGTDFSFRPNPPP
jgi:hypothetical protein